VPIDFDPFNAPLEEIWPGAWSHWSPWIERAADFDWRSYKSFYCYIDNSGPTTKQEEWDRHLQRKQVAAKLLTEGTCNEEWISLLRSLCRFEEHLAKEERFLLRSVVHNIIRIVSNLLYIAFNKNIRQLAIEHDGCAREGNLSMLCSVDGETIRPWHLLGILNERFLLSDRFVRQDLDYHFEQWRDRLNPPLKPDCATSFLDRLSTAYDEPLLSALASYKQAKDFEKDSDWENQRFWAAIRALIVATESETRRWFKSEHKLRDFLAERFKDWQRSYDPLVCSYSKKGIILNPIRETEHLVHVLTDLKEQMNKLRGQPNVRIDIQITSFLLARNWSAHVGKNPHPYYAHLGELIKDSILTILLVLWDQARSANPQVLDAIYPATDSLD